MNLQMSVRAYGASSRPPTRAANSRYLLSIVRSVESPSAYTARDSAPVRKATPPAAGKQLPVQAWQIKIAEQNDTANGLIATGAEIAGAAVGGALGFLAGGPIPAAGAGVVGVVIAKGANKLLSDFANRHLSRREEIRVGAAAAFALAAIRERLENGEKPREDNFFSEEVKGRSSAEEILEGVLQKSKNEHQEKKIKLLGNFFANVAFSPDVSVSEANHLLRVAENLTYRQMCLLAVLLVMPEMPETQWRDKDFREPDVPLTYDMISLLQELFDMCSVGLAARRNEKGPGFIAMLGWTDVTPNLMVLTPLGKRLATLLGLDKESFIVEDIEPAFYYTFQPHQEGELSN